MAWSLPNIPLFKFVNMAKETAVKDIAAVSVLTVLVFIAFTFSDAKTAQLTNGDNRLGFPFPFLY
jgi:hypothetical protein